MVGGSFHKALNWIQLFLWGRRTEQDFSCDGMLSFFSVFHVR